MSLLAALGTEYQPLRGGRWNPRAAFRVGEAKRPGPGFDDPEASDDDLLTRPEYWCEAADECFWDELHDESKEMHDLPCELSESSGDEDESHTDDAQSSQQVHSEAESPVD